MISEVVTNIQYLFTNNSLFNCLDWGSMYMPHRRNALTDDQLNWNNWIPFRLLENSFHVPSLLAIDVIFVLGHWYFKLYIAFFSVRFEVIVSPNLNSTYVNKKTIIRVIFIGISFLWMLTFPMKSNEKIP